MPQAATSRLRDHAMSVAWTDEKIAEAAEALIAVHGEKAAQQMIDISQDEIRATGNCDAIPHDRIMAEIAARLCRARPVPE